jgi:hypothetical protein
LLWSLYELPPLNCLIYFNFSDIKIFIFNFQKLQLEKKPMEEICETHNKEYDAYDLECTAFVCSDCRTTLPHKNHPCQEISLILTERKGAIYTKVSSIRGLLSQHRKVLEPQFQPVLENYVLQMNEPELSSVAQFEKYNSILSNLEILEETITSASTSQKAAFPAVSKKSHSLSVMTNTTQESEDSPMVVETDVQPLLPASPYNSSGNLNVVLLEAAARSGSCSSEEGGPNGEATMEQQDDEYEDNASNSSSIVSGVGLVKYYKNMIQMGEDHAAFRVAKDHCHGPEAIFLSVAGMNHESSAAVLHFSVKEDPAASGMFFMVVYRLASDYHPENDLLELNISINGSVLLQCPFKVRLIKLLPHKLIAGKNVEISEDGQKALAVRNRAWCRVDEAIILYEEIFMRISKGDKSGWCAIRFYDTIDIRFQGGSPSEGLYCWNLKFGTFLSRGISEGKNEHGKYDGTDTSCDISFYRDDLGIHCFCRNIPVHQFPVETSVLLYVFINNNNVTSITELINHYHR